MKTRLLISIGCNNYEYLTQLRGAEGDAHSLHNLLLDPAVGDYNKTKSRVLYSPTALEVQSAIKFVLFECGNIDTLTLFFAGHGVVKSGSYYLCTKDSRPDAFSATAVSLSDILRMIAEAQPTQSNVIIDSCESGGLGVDLSTIIKQDVLGRAGSPSITLLAASASNQDALEDAHGGLLTQEILRCISGLSFVQNSSPNLDLIDVGRFVSVQVASKGVQTPFVWGLNLFGMPRFCRNPHHQAAASKSLAALSNTSMSQVTISAITIALPKLYRVYDSISESRNLRELIDTIKPVVDSMAEQPADSIIFVSRLLEGFGQSLSNADDRLFSIEVSLTCITSLTTYTQNSLECRDFLLNAMLKVASEIDSLMEEICAAVKEDKYSLLSKYGFADLYYLPLRLSKLIAWASASYHIANTIGSSTDRAKSNLEELWRCIVNNYSTAFRAVSDCQASDLAVSLSAFSSAQLLSEGEALASLQFSSMLDCEGKVGRNDLHPEEAFKYLMARATRDWVNSEKLVAQPTELLMVLLAFANHFSIGEAFDHQLRALDYVAINAYIPSDWNNFSAEVLDTGSNHTMQIGHGMFNVDDVTAALKLAKIPSPQNQAELLACIALSLIFPDRTAWFLWSNGNV